MPNRPSKRPFEKSLESKTNEPALKRSRLSNSTENGTTNNELKHHTLTKQQLNELPCILNPNLYKAVFESYRLPRKISVPTKNI